MEPKAPKAETILAPLMASERWRQYALGGFIGLVFLAIAVAAVLTQISR